MRRPPGACDYGPHIFHDLIGTHYQQDVDLDKLFMDVSVYNERIMGPAHVRPVVDAAIRTAMARRGVAHITIPKDIQEWDVTENKRSEANIPDHSGKRFQPSYPIPAQALLEQAAAVLNDGRRIVMLVGSGALSARQEVIQAAECIGAPVVKALLGKAVIHRTVGYRTLAGSHERVRHAADGRDQFPLHAVSS